MNENKLIYKKIEFYVFAGMILLCFLCCLLLYKKAAKIEEVDISKEAVSEEVLHYKIETMKKENNHYILSGYAYKPDEDIEFSNNNIVLKNVKTNQFYKLNTEFVQRGDVTTTINDGHNYDNSGFFVRVMCSKFEKAQEYQICFWYQSTNNNIFYETEDTIVPNP
jgi:hypothetical protein